MQLSDEAKPMENYDMLHFTPEEDKPTDYMWSPGSFMRRDIGDNVKLINSYPTSQKRAALELLARIDNNEIDDIDSILEANPWMDDSLFNAIKSIASNDNKGRIPVITKSSLKRNKAAKSEIESLVEEHPEVIKETVPEDNPIHKEAEQVTDGDARTTEANNEKIEEGIKQGGIDWDKIERNWNAEHEAAANPSSEYKDEFGRDVPDFVSKIGRAHV